MSSKGYVTRWADAVDDLKSIIATERALQNIGPVLDRSQVHNNMSQLYVRYIILVNNLSDLYDQMLQYQRRVVIQQLLEAATKRLLEWRKELCQLELSDFVYVEQALVQLELIPQSALLARPHHFPFKRADEVQALIDAFRAECDEVIENESFGEKTADQDNVEDDVDLTVAEFARKSTSSESAVDQEIAEFKYDENVPPLFPISKTKLPTNFHLEGTDTEFEFYKNPNVENRSASTIAENGSQSSIGCARSLLPPKTCRPPHIFDSTEWLLAQNTEPLKSASEIMRETKRRNMELAAVKTIRQAWKRYILCKYMIDRRNEKQRFIGMQQDFSDSDGAKDEVVAMREARRAKKGQFAEQYKKTIEAVQSKATETRKCCIQQDTIDNIRQWYREMYGAVHEFQDYPSAAKGGSAAILLGETLSLDEFTEFVRTREENKLKSPEERKKGVAKAKEKLAKEEKLLQKAEREKQKQAMKDGPSWDFSSKTFATKSFEYLADAVQKYEHDLRSIDEHHGASDAPIVELIVLDVYAKMHIDLRPDIDEKMRAELKCLQMALCTDLKKKYKSKKNKGNKKKVKSRQRNSQPAQPLDSTAVSAMFDELVSCGVLIKYPNVTLDDYVADFNYAAYDLRQAEHIDPLPGGLEMKQVLRMHLLGMGPFNIEKPKSICLAGPPGCGKKFLLYAMASEIDAVILDISPSKIHQFENDMDRFIGVIRKMSKLLEPTIIFVDHAHKPFSKRVFPGDEEINVKLIAKFLPGIRKSIKPLDKIMLIGVTNEPWSGNAKVMNKIFEKRWLCPSNDYGTTFQLWRNGIGRKLGTDPGMLVSPLARVTRAFPAAAVLTCIERVLSAKRKRELIFRPLEPKEFLDNLMTTSIPLTNDKLAKYRKWFSRANAFEKDRIKRLNALRSDDKGKKKK